MRSPSATAAPHPVDAKKAIVSGRHLLAANDPLSERDRKLAAMFAGPDAAFLEFDKQVKASNAGAAS